MERGVQHPLDTFLLLFRVVPPNPTQPNSEQCSVTWLASAHAPPLPDPRPPPPCPGPRVRRQQNITAFQLQFESSDKGANSRGGSFLADFTLTPSAQTQSLFVPFSSFTEDFRGQKIGGPPSLKQLATIVQIGVGADGTAGNFDVEMKSIVATNSAPAPGPAPGPSPAPSDGKILVSFEQGRKDEYKWFVVNDPVMGGLSRATFTEDAANEVGVFNGTVAIVPSLKAPGFCNAEARPGLFGQKIPDV